MTRDQHPVSTSVRVGVLASGGLGLTSLITISKVGPIAFVLTDRRSEPIQAFCEHHRIDCFVGNPCRGRVTTFLNDHPCDVILSLNYLFLVEDDVLDHPSRYAINFHGSLLPRYRGRTPHVWAVINNETQTGVTAHLMRKECDAGDIVLQHPVPIAYDQTGADLLDEFHKIYPKMIREILTAIDQGTLTANPQDHSKATYFGKRTPDDGAIVWDWYRERIYNWIRAQANPYPGAFFHYGDGRYHVHGSRLVDDGFDGRDPNGTVLSLQPLVVKTANGAIELTNHTLPTAMVSSSNSPIMLT